MFEKYLTSIVFFAFQIAMLVVPKVFLGDADFSLYIRVYAVLIFFESFSFLKLDQYFSQAHGFFRNKAKLAGALGLTSLVFFVIVGTVTRNVSFSLLLVILFIGSSLFQLAITHASLEGMHRLIALGRGVVAIAGCAGLLVSVKIASPEAFLVSARVAQAILGGIVLWWLVRKAPARRANESQVFSFRAAGFLLAGSMLANGAIYPLTEVPHQYTGKQDFANWAFLLRLSSGITSFLVVLAGPRILSAARNGNTEALFRFLKLLLGAGLIALPLVAGMAFTGVLHRLVDFTPLQLIVAVFCCIPGVLYSVTSLYFPYAGMGKAVLKNEALKCFFVCLVFVVSNSVYQCVSGAQASIPVVVLFGEYFLVYLVSTLAALRVLQRSKQ